MLKPLLWVGHSRKEIREFPEEVQDQVGYALYVAQLGAQHPDAKALQGFGSAGVLEVVTNFDGNTYRTVYTVRLKTAVYVLHAFQKKSTRGVKTSQRDIELIGNRLRQAEQDDQRRAKGEAEG